MPCFFFDIRDGHLIVDDVGSEFPNVHAARNAAIKVLPDVAREQIGAGESREVSVLMRDEAGRNLFTATLNLTCRWLVDTA
ncbi:hypothetical protein VQ02_22265 [Methylobacterium variabile]|jgi:hypothetical protein|uniref:DUF6894 domain-containing protein n=1 Tax=Methylobacterium variabile TaxID=298794 RepID=A0A0J6V2E5_9HYPH|nr:hypothetical protein [Methylobacterium variabile]KMO32991.1 hypothetical protein VQ02_22265 [Methylobacterium variabile]